MGKTEETIHSTVFTWHWNFHDVIRLFFTYTVNREECMHITIIITNFIREKTYIF
jgi:hypothetical protein